jgi:hypothetical protein
MHGVFHSVSGEVYVPYGGRMVLWLCLVSTAVLFARDVDIGMMYRMSGAEASYCVGARLKTASLS